MSDEQVNERNDEELIEREVVRTQDEIGETVQQLEEKLNPKDLAQPLLDSDAMDTAKEALEVARRNPLPVALIAIGSVWLFATSDAPLIRNFRERLGERFGLRSNRQGLRPRSEEPAPIGPPPAAGEAYDRRGAGTT